MGDTSFLSRDAVGPLPRFAGSSHPPHATRGDFVVGIDEAGRGPVLGPMVYGACVCPVHQMAALERMRFMDSKTLSEGRREELFQAVRTCEFLHWRVDAIPPEELSAKMLRRKKCNLNTISHEAAVSLIQNFLDLGYHITHAFVDTVGVAEKYRAYLSEKFPSMEVTVAAKADSKYAIVSAASICAKVYRDMSLRRWEFQEKGLCVTGDRGSGYPADPITKNWLTRNIDPVFGFPSIVRFSWSTSREILKRKTVAVDWGHSSEEEEEGEDKREGKKKKKTKKQDRRPGYTLSRPVPVRFRYFIERGLEIVEDF